LHATSVKSLRGKNFGSTGAGSPGAYAVYKLGQKLGWKKGTDYKTTTLGDIKALIAALKSGSIDAFAWSDSVAFQLQNSGVANIIRKASTYVGPNMLEAFSVRGSYAKEHKAALKVFFTKYFA